VHKVIRWAFEAQGLYRSFNNGPGYPPRVDIYIESLRPAVDATCGVDYGAGSYVPVSLEWALTQRGSDEPPAWQAAPDAIKVQSTTNITVRVQNRGSRDATNVQVTIWIRAWPATTPPPKWNAAGWMKSPSVGPQTVPAGAPAVSFTLAPTSPLSPGTRYIIVAQTTCADDAANTDATTGLPCSSSTQQTELVDLIANDNNLGLRVFGG